MPAPSLQLPLSTGAPIVQAFAATSASTAGATAVEIASHSAAAPVQTLNIQLHPAELGMVTAKLRMTDGQLSIEVEVETPDAYAKLSGESDAIARALRSHGISVDQVVIQAPPAQSGSSARDSAGNFADTSAGAGRNGSGSTDSGQSNGSGHANRNAGYDNGHDVERASSAQPRTDSGSAGHGVYI
jgi:chemotaxis protein MotD